jgi:hypothetical protein
MNAFAAFILRGPGQAASLACATLLLASVLPPLAWLSAAILALVMLQLGPTAYGYAAGLGLLALVAAGWLVLGQPVAVATAAASAWLPAGMVALMLHRRARLDDALLVACGLGWLLVIALHASLDAPVQWWQELLRQFMPPERVEADLGIPAARVHELIDQAAPLMSGMLAASAVVGATSSVLLARWWQAALYHPGAFGEEFRSLRLGRVAASILVIVCAAALALPSILLKGLAFVALAVYLFQGLSVAHGVAKLRGMGTVWLAGLYIIGLLALPQMVLALALLGVLDAWADFRRRVGTQT